VAALELADHRVVGDELVGRIGLAEEGRERRHQGIGTVAPGAGGDDAVAPDADVERRGAVGRARGQPGLVALQPDRSVAQPMAKRAERLGEMDRSAQRDAALDHRRMESRIGVEPACTVSSSARLRMPR
jgi:hypothetical protein